MSNVSTGVTSEWYYNSEWKENNDTISKRKETNIPKINILLDESGLPK